MLVVIPQNGPFGSNRGVVGREYPNPIPLVVDGVTISVVAEAYIGAPPNLGVVAHELGHLLSNLPDLYFALPTTGMWAGIPFDNPFAAGDYCLMDATYNNAHFCPFLRLKLGWLRPRLILQVGALRAARDRAAARGLDSDAIRSRGTREYFIVENRFPDNNYDMNLPDRGLGVWHVIEDPAIYGTHIPPVPPNPPASSRQDLWAQKWALIAANDWGRRGIRMIRPVWDTLPWKPVAVGRIGSGDRLRPAAGRPAAAGQLALGRRHAERVRHPAHLGSRRADGRGHHRAVVRVWGSAGGHCRPPARSR